MPSVPPSSFTAPTFPRLQCCDIFCRIIDNYGDIGICWRLARQLAAEHGFIVRLWVDNLLAFCRICHGINPQRDIQTLSGIKVLRWSDGAEAINETIEPGDLVIETFACHLPENFIEAMATKPAPPVWINLDYLSAEAWVGRYHALPSPHPRLPLTKYFFFPGFDETTGGLLRERNLDARRQQFLNSVSERAAFWCLTGLPPPPENALLISLFTYENPALPALLKQLAQNRAPVCCLTPTTQTQVNIEAFLAHPVQTGTSCRHGALEIRPLSWLAQSDYDHLLWLCDINFVRGEDSFVRAQWAARPLIWQIYPQSENAHRAKLDAFLDRYTATLGAEAATRVRRFHLAWNGFGTLTDDSIDDYLASLPELHQHAQRWNKNLSEQQDLCSALVRFCQSKAIIGG